MKCIAQISITHQLQERALIKTMFKASTVLYIFCIYISAQTNAKSGPRVRDSKCCNGFEISSHIQRDTLYICCYIFSEDLQICTILSL